MSDWKTRKEGKGDQRGLRFRTTGEGDEKTISKEDAREYLKELVKESQTYDINTVIGKLKAEGRSVTSEFKEADKIRSIAEQRSAVVERVLEILYEIRSSGRTRVGESELKTIIRKVMAEMGVSPGVLEIKI